MYELNHYMQDAVIKLLIEDKEFLRRGASIVEPIIFTEIIRKEVCRESLNFYATYGDSIGYEALRIGNNNSKKKNIIEEAGGYLDNLKEMKVNREFILGELRNFVKKMYLIRALDDSEELLKQGQLEEIEKRITSALRKGMKDTDTGRVYLDDGMEAYIRKSANPAVLLQIGDIDRRALGGRGVESGRLACFMGDPKGKKSWSLAHIAIQGALQGMPVLVIPLELRADEFVHRLDMILSGLSEEELINNPEKAIKSRSKLKRYGGGIIIEHFPQGTFSVKEVEQLIEKLEVERGFSPLLVIIDYGDLLRSEEFHRDERNKKDEIFGRLRSLADKRSIICFTATRSQRTAIGKEKKKQHVSEDIRIMNHVDYMFGLSHPAENVIRVDVVANRTGKEGFHADVKIDLNRGLVFGEEVNLEKEGEG